VVRLEEKGAEPRFVIQSHWPMGFPSWHSAIVPATHPETAISIFRDILPFGDGIALLERPEGAHWCAPAGLACPVLPVRRPRVSPLLPS
jgi:hypothetical protein